MMSYPAHTSEAHPEVFTKVPPQPSTLKPGQLTKEHVRKFFEEGFVVVEDFFDKQNELDPIKEDISNLVDQLATKLHDSGKIQSLHKDEGFYTRLSKLEEEFPGSNIILHKPRHLNMTKNIFKLWTNSRLLNVAEQLLNSPDIVGHPVWNLRTKTPGNEHTMVPWHQDVAYLDNDSYNVLHVSAWIPLLDANKHNGCMEMVRGGHRSGKVAIHKVAWKDTWYVVLPEDEIKTTLGCDVEKEKVFAEIPYGGVLFFNNLIPHRTWHNTSNQVRWSLDMRWQRADQPIGFHGLSEGTLMRKCDDEDFQADYEEYIKTLKPDGCTGFSDDFDTTMPGPWMTRWEITHSNRHTDASLKKFTPAK